MEKINGIFIVGCVILACVCIYIYSNRSEAEEKFKEEIPQWLKDAMKTVGRKKLSEEDIKGCTRFSWIKLLLFDVLVCVGAMFAVVDSKMDKGDIKSGVVIALVIIAVTNLAAFVIDMLRHSRIRKNRDSICCVPIYVHNILNGHAYISYYNHDQYSMELKQIKFSEDDMLLLRRMNNGEIPGVFLVRDSVMKFIKVYPVKKV